MATFYVDKGTDLMRSTLTVYGLAKVLNTYARQDIQIQDMGSFYQLQTTKSMEELEKQANDNKLSLVLPAIVKPFSAKELKQIEADEQAKVMIYRRYVPAYTPNYSNFHDYGKEKAKEQANNKQNIREEGAPPQRHPDFPLWAYLCSHFGKGSAMRVGYPLLLHIWQSHRDYPEGNRAILETLKIAYSEVPNRIDEAEHYWLTQIKPELQYPDFAMFKWEGNDARVSALSIVSPTTAQGAFTDSAARSINTSTPTIFWLELYFAMVGYMTVAMPYRVSGGDVVLYYPLPTQIKITQADKLTSKYRKDAKVKHLYDFSNLYPLAKLDALAQINFFMTFVEQLRRGELKQRNTISGIVGYYYKDISTQIPFDETTFRLPGWLAYETDREDFETAHYILEQHRTLIERIRGDHAEELLILQHYRRFITLGHPDDWVQFAIAYSQHRFKKLTDYRLPDLSLSVFTETLMNNSHKDYRPILENDGFRNIAQAINHATVYMRYAKDVKKRSTAFKVRHGLGDDLLRRAHDADAFVEDLSKFVHDYMRESSNVQANTGESRYFVTDQDLHDVMGLVAEYGSRVVANLLVATGYASRYDRNKSTDESSE